ncbi:MAG: MarR family winged helix-turn-helix transcriptional regulator [Granulosicoccus sp.]
MDDLKFDDDLYEAIELMYRAYRSFTTKPDRILEKRGLNRAHHRILYFVGKIPDLSINDLLQELAISKQALHTPLSQLIAMGLIVRKKSTRDGRVKMLRLSATGKRLETRLTGVQSEQLKQVFEQAGCDAEDAWRLVMRGLQNTI